MKLLKYLPVQILKKNKINLVVMLEDCKVLKNLIEIKKKS